MKMEGVVGDKLDSHPCGLGLCLGRAGSGPREGCLPLGIGIRSVTA